MTYKILLMISFATLYLSTGCVEIQDKENDLPQAKILVYEARNLTVDEPYFLVGGELVPQRQLQSREALKVSRDLAGTRPHYELKFDHLNFVDGGVIYTLGYDVSFEIQDLNSNNGLIQTFPAGQQAPPNVPGADGGNIKIHVQHARGSLSLNLVGERGGQGLKGTDLDGDKLICDAIFVSSNPGSAGKRGGKSGDAEVVIQDDAGFSFTPALEAGTGGPGGAGGLGYRMCNGLRSEPGSVGARGSSGDRGKICVTRGGLDQQCM